MDNLWKRINHLVPEPQCTTKGDKIIKWTDKRKRPTKAQLEAVDIQSIIIVEDKKALILVEANKRILSLPGAKDILKIADDILIDLETEIKPSDLDIENHILWP